MLGVLIFEKGFSFLELVSLLLPPRVDPPPPAAGVPPNKLPGPDFPALANGLEEVVLLLPPPNKFEEVLFPTLGNSDGADVVGAEEAVAPPNKLGCCVEEVLLLLLAF